MNGDTNRRTFVEQASGLTLYIEESYQTTPPLGENHERQRMKSYYVLFRSKLGLLLEPLVLFLLSKSGYRL